MSLITSSIDLGKPGKQTGFLRLPHSTHESAYGWMPIPIVSIVGSPGPTVLAIAGNHGDEYEGQIALMRLCRELRASDVSGRLIILPAANFPAVMAGRRVSPIDQGNLNRSFPGRRDGSPTEMMADYIYTQLLPQTDFVIDLHSGGSSLRYLPAVLARLNSPPDQWDVVLQAITAFAPDYGCLFRPLSGENRTFSGAAEELKLVYLCMELGGGGTIDPIILGRTEAGIRRVLTAFGLLGEHGAPENDTRFVSIRGFENYVYAPEGGLFEPFAEPGDEVLSGQIAGLVHFPETPWRAPVEVPFGMQGVVLCKRVPSMTKRGDCLFQLGGDYSPE